MDLIKVGGTITVNEIMTSLQIAEVTGKEHKSVLRDIRNLIEGLSNNNEIGGYTFVPTYYLDSQGKKQPMYELNKKECLLLASGYDIVLRAKIINRWEELEKQNHNQLQPFKVPTTFREALLLSAEQQEVIEKQQLQLTEQAPKVLFASAVETAKQSCLVGELSKILKQNGIEIGQNRLFEWLRKNNYLCSKGECYNLPTQKAMELGLFEVKKGTVVNADGSVRVTTTTKVTGKGSIYFINKFLNK